MLFKITLSEEKNVIFSPECTSVNVVGCGQDELWVELGTPPCDRVDRIGRLLVERGCKDGRAGEEVECGANGKDSYLKVITFSFEKGIKANVLTLATTFST